MLNSMDKNNKQQRIDAIMIDDGATLIDALQQMDKAASKLLIVTREQKFYSLVSIGDLQRAMIAYQSFSKKISEILRPKIEVGHVADDRKFLLDIMLQNRTEFMPLLDDKGNLAEVIFWDEIVAHSVHINNELKDVPVVIMAGGKGSRLKPITNIIPKALVPLGEKPIMEIIADQFVRCGVQQFFASVNYKADLIKKYFDEIPGKNYSIAYTSENQPLGTIGSISLMKKNIRSTFFVSNCDILIDQDFSDVYRFHKAGSHELTLISAIKSYHIPYGTIELNNNGLLNQLKEKPQLMYYINTGVYVLEPHLINEVPENSFYDITDLIEKILARGGRVGVFPVSENAWLDIGEWKEYDKSLQLFSTRFAHLI